jgi:hypothetical protein
MDHVRTSLVNIYITTLAYNAKQHCQQSSTTMGNNHQQLWSNIVNKHGQTTLNTTVNIITYHGQPSSNTMVKHHQTPLSHIIKPHCNKLLNTIVTKTQIVKNHVQT